MCRRRYGLWALFLAQIMSSDKRSGSGALIQEKARGLRTVS